MSDRAGDVPATELPDGWVWAELGEILPLQYGKGLPKRDRDRAGTVPVFGSSGHVDTHNAALTSDPAIVVGRKGNAGAVYYSAQPCWPIDTAYYVEPAPGLDPEFFAYLLDSLTLASHDQSTAIPSLIREVYNRVRVPVPPSNEQRRIVEKIETLLSEIANGVESLDAVDRKLATYRRSVLQAAAYGRLSGISGSVDHNLGTEAEWALPAGWRWTTIGAIARRVRNGLSKKPTPQATKHPILRISAVRPMSINESDTRFYPGNTGERLEEFQISDGDILFTRYNGSKEFTGICGVVKNTSSPLHPDKLIRVTLDDISQTLPTFVAAAANFGPTRAYIRARIRTSAGQNGVSGTDIKSAPLALPPVEEQRRLCGLIDEMFRVTSAASSANSREQSRARSLRRSILKSAFAGRLVSQDPNDEPASELLARIRAEHAGTPKASSGRGRPRKTSRTSAGAKP